MLQKGLGCPVECFVPSAVSAGAALASDVCSEEVSRCYVRCGCKFSCIGGGQGTASHSQKADWCLDVQSDTLPSYGSIGT